MPTTTADTVAAEAVQPPDTARPPVLTKLNRHRFLVAALNWGLNYYPRELLMPLFRSFCPIWQVPFLGFVVVFRDEHVREVLAHNREFPVPFAVRMIEVTGKENFVLGMEDGPEYQRNYQQLATAFPRADVPLEVVPRAARISEAILQNRSRLDAVRDLFWAVPAQLCDDYFGIEIPHPLLLADWSVAMSSYLFNPQEHADPAGRNLALTAAAGIRGLIRRAIRNTRAGHRRGVVLPRLIRMQENDPQLTDSVLEAHLFGMVTGFIPTNLLASGNILDTLLRNRSFMKQAQQAAREGDDDLLWRCLREALRFRHINPGPFRICGPEGYTLAAGTRFERRIAAGTRILASTQSAMFDGRRIKCPRKFDPGRAGDEYLIFGYGQHWCLGLYIASAQITQTFKALLRQRNLRRTPGPSGRLTRFSIYPAHLTVEYRQ